MIPPSDRRATRRGYTIVEIMVVLTMMGILMSVAATSFRRALEQSRFDLAAANLRSIWTAERLYWLEHHTYAGGAGGLNFLVGEGLIDPSMVADARFYSYAIPSADSTTFTATATRINSPWIGTITIDQTGALSLPGGLQAPGESPIFPVSQ